MPLPLPLLPPPPPSCFFSDERSQLGCCVADWSNGKGTGTADGWAKHKPMDDEEMLFKQVQMTAAATPGTTVWVGLTPASPADAKQTELCDALPTGLPQHRVRLPVVH